MASNSIELPQIDRSAIEWTGATWNPWQGCIKVSPGCAHCYMYADKKRYGQDPRDVHRSAPATFNKPLKWQREVERGERTGNDRFVFTCSWSDWFIEQADAWRPDAWDIVRRCPGLIFQILTKRAHRITGHLPAYWEEIAERTWIGVSVENQAAADERIPHLLRCPAAVRFLSCEPLLGAVDLKLVEHVPYLLHGSYGKSEGIDSRIERRAIHWAIVGGESGAGARPCGIDWIRDIIGQCKVASVPCFVKQLGARPVTRPGHSYMVADIRDRKGGDWSEWPEDLRVREFPAIPTERSA